MARSKHDSCQVVKERWNRFNLLERFRINLGSYEHLTPDVFLEFLHINWVLAVDVSTPSAHIFSANVSLVSIPEELDYTFVTVIFGFVFKISPGLRHVLPFDSGGDEIG